MKVRVTKIYYQYYSWDCAGDEPAISSDPEEDERIYELTGYYPSSYYPSKKRCSTTDHIYLYVSFITEIGTEGSFKTELYSINIYHLPDKLIDDFNFVHQIQEKISSPFYNKRIRKEFIVPSKPILFKTDEAEIYRFYKSTINVGDTIEIDFDDIEINLVTIENGKECYSLYRREIDIREYLSKDFPSKIVLEIEDAKLIKMY